MFNKLLLALVLRMLILISCFPPDWVDCVEKPEASIKNMTEIEKAKPKPKHNDEPFRKDLRRYQRECGADISGEDDDDDDNNGGERSAEEVPLPTGQWTTDNAPNAHWAYEQKKHGGGKGGTYPSQYGKRPNAGHRGGSDEESEEDEGEDDYRGSSNRRKGGSSRRRNPKGSKKGRPSDDYDDSDGDNCDAPRKSAGGGRKGGPASSGQWGGAGGGGMGGTGWSHRDGSSGGRHNNRNNAHSGGYSGGDPFGQKSDYGVIYSSSPELWSSRYGFSTYGGRLAAMNMLRRMKRQKNEEQCVSQCVFGYMEMLDDNRVPAETEVIKYFQHKIFNNSERMKLIKLTRTCFARLSTTEIAESEDGCQFSKDLARCLHIDIKGEMK